MWMPRCGYAVGANASLAKAHRSSDLAQPGPRAEAIALPAKGAVLAVCVDRFPCAHRSLYVVLAKKAAKSALTSPVRGPGLPQAARAA